MEKNGTFYLMMIPAVVLLSFLAINLSDRGQMELFNIRHEASEKNDMKSNLPFFMNKNVMAKVEKLKANPQALKRLSGEKRKMAEKYLAMMKNK